MYRMSRVKFFWGGLVTVHDVVVPQFGQLRLEVRTYSVNTRRTTSSTELELRNKNKHGSVP